MAHKLHLLPVTSQHNQEKQRSVSGNRPSPEIFSFSEIAHTLHLLPVTSQHNQKTTVSLRQPSFAGNIFFPIYLHRPDPTRRPAGPAPARPPG
ncbi:hypothetical protein HanIR_Chr04g0184621 [Helianthus annuus]|nr:hypothetical protein HanIR_Chr04g0184621 [Helianthus annuus]